MPFQIKKKLKVSVNPLSYLMYIKHPDVQNIQASIILLLFRSFTLIYIIPFLQVQNPNFTLKFTP